MEKNARVDENTPSVISGQRNTIQVGGEAARPHEMKKAASVAEQQRQLQRELPENDPEA